MVEMESMCYLMEFLTKAIFWFNLNLLLKHKEKMCYGSGFMKRGLFRRKKWYGWMSLGRHLWASNHSPKSLLSPQPTQNLNVFDKTLSIHKLSDRNFMRQNVLKWQPNICNWFELEMCFHLKYMIAEPPPPPSLHLLLWGNPLYS